jgi:xanthine dehydrogenase accessory factor
MKRADGTWESIDDYVLDFAIEQVKNGYRFVLVTLVKIEGSSPRPLGAQMAISETGDSVGYLSGGCIEREIVSEALNALKEMKSRRVRYGKGSKYIDIKLPCASAIELFFDVSQQANVLEAIDNAVSSRSPTDFEFTVTAEDFIGQDIVNQHYLPRRRLFVAGVGPAAVQLCRLAIVAGFEVELVSGDASTRDFAEVAGARIHNLTNPRKPPELRLDRWTAIVFMFHDHDFEEEMIPSALGTQAFYIGAMGSRETHRQRLEKLRARGFDESALDRIFGPAGIFAGLKNAADIALSILAEVVQIERSLRSKERTVRVEANRAMLWKTYRHIDIDVCRQGIRS